MPKSISSERNKPRRSPCPIIKENSIEQINDALENTVLTKPGTNNDKADGALKDHGVAGSADGGEIGRKLTVYSDEVLDTEESENGLDSLDSADYRRSIRSSASLDASRRYR
jgi:hypothetical protein